jgi:methanethiol oxidase
VIDTKDNPKQPKIVKVTEPKDVAERTGYSRPPTIHCGPDGIYLSALGSPSGDGPGGIFPLDHYNFEPLGRWEVDRGPQYFGYDFA